MIYIETISEGLLSSVQSKLKNYSALKNSATSSISQVKSVELLTHNEDMFSGLAVNFPTGTLSGAPKIEAMKIIDVNENSARGPYGGAVGHFGFNGDCTFAIAIRSLFLSGTYGYTQTSGGIVADSDPDLEYQEILNKLAAMKKVLDMDSYVYD